MGYNVTIKGYEVELKSKSGFSYSNTILTDCPVDAIVKSRQRFREIFNKEIEIIDIKLKKFTEEKYNELVNFYKKSKWTGD